ncbi:MAG: Ubiquinone biosynthesis O-methyltransferase, mitochondrial [Chlamydiales bacterium]|nr:Ubiquinone biosynthesis O-methyltransferase, mitochondrial [Chlamydiales bacterium]MCH9619501.1 Ubiquinone biosynthesis O-methyltransferase, mitochondrial [Chlamydiales bacterium]MCH9622305.1 Ubiquinone biosynthesis O-methyltransferase, mitochondrial [Chlamydiales bacterium]
MRVKEQKSDWKRYVDGTEEQFMCEEIALGPWTSYSLKSDPKHMAFVLARYKFCAKLLEGSDFVVEIGCGDGFGLPLVAQAVSHLHCLDWDERNLENCSRRLSHLKNVTYELININQTTLDLKADAVYCVDVIEHLEPQSEAEFMQNISKLLKEESKLIIGTPNKTASGYASPQSASQHINLHTMESLKALTNQYFKHVFMFGMNDEVVHTGYSPMCQYIWSVGAEKRLINP